MAIAIFKSLVDLLINLTCGICVTDDHLVLDNERESVLQRGRTSSAPGLRLLPSPRGDDVSVPCDGGITGSV